MAESCDKRDPRGRKESMPASHLAESSSCYEYQYDDDHDNMDSGVGKSLKSLSISEASAELVQRGSRSEETEQDLQEPEEVQADFSGSRPGKSQNFSLSVSGVEQRCEQTPETGRHSSGLKESIQSDRSQTNIIQKLKFEATVSGSKTTAEQSDILDSGVGLSLEPSRALLWKQLKIDCSGKSLSTVNDNLQRKPLPQEQLDDANRVIWEEGDEYGNFEALIDASNGDNGAVNFAVGTAKDYKRFNACNNDRQTVLHYAVAKCSAETVRNIVTKGADSTLTDVYGDTPMHIAARIGRHEVIKLLNACLTRSEVDHMYFKVPYRSLPVSGLGNKMNHQGWTPLHVAAEHGHRDCLVALVKHAKSDIDCRRLGDGYTAAHIAVDLKRIDMLQACLELSSDSEVRNYRGETPQQMAFLMRRHDMVELCQRYGASPRQLEYAETEQLDWEDEDMDCDEEPHGFVAQECA